MARSTASTALVAAAFAAVALTADVAPVADLHRRGGTGAFAGVGYGAWGYGAPGYGGWGFFPYAASSTNAFNANSNFAHFNDDTLYVNNKDATAANGNVNTFNQANVVA
ncbi:hypothetical protein H4R21_003167 [Coemansia helicoidea]|uniref:Uncharacterized protein n=1 Tax=Coemansia helicoidea TaxID=1286919 RepID=A0ACC1L4P1_9FUNG|nr:hypothetical protein H4R21_003167 [Coemansia helicoidea]